MAERVVSESVATGEVVSALTDCKVKIIDPATKATNMTESKAKALVFVFISCVSPPNSKKRVDDKLLNDFSRLDHN
jgi:hypothetical protein